MAIPKRFPQRPGSGATRAAVAGFPYIGRVPALTATERRACGAFGVLVLGNPFEVEHPDAERRALEPGRTDWPELPASAAWSFQPGGGRRRLDELAAAAEVLAKSIAGRARRPGDVERELAAAPGRYALFYRVQDELLALAEAEEAGREARPVRGAWRRFGAGHAELLAPVGDPLPQGHLFALFFQIRRAFRLIFDRIWGGGAAAAALRADVWQSVFTRDRGRYARSLYGGMDSLPTLVLGESGTGKEVVARALAGSRYRAFDPRSAAFAPPGRFEAMNLAALPATLVESELFGHRRGSFTGAVADRPGRLENVGAGGTALLDEVGDLDPAAQVKLLRVLQERTFCRLGDDRPRRFEGKVVAATHRDLPAMVASGDFRADLYYRLAGDVLRTPPLRELIAGDAAELERLASLAAERVAPGAGLAGEVVEAVRRGVGLGHPWPGNFREFEQCVRSTLVRGEYRPIPAADDLAGRIGRLDLTADDLLAAYCRLAVGRLGGYEPAARRLKLDRRTVKAKCGRAGEKSLRPPPGPV